MLLKCKEICLSIYRWLTIHKETHSHLHLNNVWFLLIFEGFATNIKNDDPCLFGGCLEVCFSDHYSVYWHWLVVVCQMVHLQNVLDFLSAIDFLCDTNTARERLWVDHWSFFVVVVVFKKNFTTVGNHRIDTTLYHISTPTRLSLWCAL